MNIVSPNVLFTCLFIRSAVLTVQGRAGRLSRLVYDPKRAKMAFRALNYIKYIQLFVMQTHTPKNTHTHTCTPPSVGRQHRREALNIHYLKFRWRCPLTMSKNCSRIQTTPLDRPHYPRLLPPPSPLPLPPLYPCSPRALPSLR